MSKGKYGKGEVSSLSVISHAIKKEGARRRGNIMIICQCGRHMENDPRSIGVCDVCGESLDINNQYA